MLGRIVPFFMGLALLFGGGCSRSYDGTVVIPRPLDVRRFWDRPPPNVDYGQSEVENGAFPVAPQPDRRFSERKVSHTAPRRHQTRLPASASLSAPAKPLTCRNVSEPGKRARMVCD
ncbi:hypothetical protein EN974_22745 [Mesorhizobium sp. M7A.F.Ca.CA.001.12.2.1]|nr:hypothetical protein EN974_22745 [Mesorhizobium sp. M7A.F.Ca.CA.001.12.2.1]RUZ28036.1 hypothetical protein EN949_07780 [Mesorhizobium sp. M7A.F.Ca.US.007.01.2.1]RUZ37361.1 hypothetical protein EN948_33845 [Mesorhizobium sp. M7A.F.Ca.US.003.02.1.1]RUZ52856.1 hypothetical protein EN950_31525 [Mesorhizobium sp. M7A.F.Ca.US.007.01.1.1]RUZ79041.1 hypothetical protein EN947_21225 [Mesorhizobium sp. M7A.F.Ca.US.003.02.2.1]